VLLAATENLKWQHDQHDFFRRGTRGWRCYCFDRTNEAVAALGDSLNELLAASAFAQCLSQERNMRGKATFFNNRICPNLLEQFVSSDGVAAALNQCNEDLDGLGSERHALAFAQ